VTGFALFVIAQTIALAHMADASIHTNDAPCQICQAIGHAAAPPAAIVAPVVSALIRVVAVCVDIVSVPLRATFSPHAPRAPPAAV
jgi:hypothetical protein